MKPGINIKRWILLGIIGVLFLVFGIIEIINKEYFSLGNIGFSIFTYRYWSFELYM